MKQIYNENNIIDSFMEELTEDDKIKGPIDLGTFNIEELPKLNLILTEPKKKETLKKVKIIDSKKNNNNTKELF